MSLLKTQPKLQLRPIWQIAIAVFIALSIPATVILLRDQLDIRSGASPTENPGEVVISNISNTSTTISFETPAQKTRSIINYGESENSLTSSSFDERRKYDPNISDLFKLHYHKLINLKPDTTYYFSITVGDKVYTNANYKFKTLNTSALQVPVPLNGSVEGGQFDEGILYIHMKSGNSRSSIISELLPKSGNFAISLGSATDNAGNSFISIQAYSDSDVYIFANAAEKGKGAIKTKKDTKDIKLQLSTQAKEYNPERLETELGGTGLPTGQPSSNPSSTIPVSQQPQADIDNTSKSILYDKFNIEGMDLTTPKNISISNPSSTSFTVSWTTSKPAKGAIAYGKNANPNTLTYDKRDSASNQLARYTHMVDITDSNLKVGDIVSFLIISDGKEYINESEYFKYKVPSIQNAPNPQSIELKIIPEFTANDESKDFIVLAKTSNSAWISSTVNQSLNSSVAIGILLNRTLSSNIPVNENDNIELTVFGENNSIISQQYTYKKDSVVELKPQKGITLSNIDNEQQIKPGQTLNGETKPNTDVRIKIGNSTAVSVKSDAQGKWSYTLPPNSEKGMQKVEISSDASKIELNINIESEQGQPTSRPSATPTRFLTTTPTSTPTPDLADTALDPIFIDYFYGFAILLAGFYLFKLSSRKDSGSF